MLIGQEILKSAPAETGAANIVTSVVFGYRGIDTLVEIAILFSAATSAGLVQVSVVKIRAVTLMGALY